MRSIDILEKGLLFITIGILVLSTTYFSNLIADNFAWLIQHLNIPEINFIQL